MTQLDRTADIPRRAVDRTRSGRHGGSIGLVLFLGLMLVGAGAGLLLAAGILGLSDKQAASPIIKSLVDRARDGLLVTDAGGRVVYANAAYLDLIEASDSNDARPIERAFVGDAGVSEAVYRLLRAARE